MLLCAILPYTPLTKANLMTFVRQISPDAMHSLLISIIGDVYDKSIGIVSITAIVTIWSAGKGVLALMRGLNAINDVEEDRNYVLLRMIASLYTVLLLAAVLVSLLTMVFGKSLIGVIEGFIPQSAYLFDVLLHFRMLFVWSVLTIVIAIMYAYMPGKRLPFTMQLPGAAFASVAWSVMTWGFSIYIDEFNGFDTYGSLTTIIILMLWLYAAMYIIMVGAYTNRYFKPAFQFFAGKKHIDRKEKIG
jgi:membrane protein